MSRIGRPPTVVGEFDWKWREWLNNIWKVFGPLGDIVGFLDPRFAKITVVENVDSPYTVIDTDIHLFCNPTTGNIIINLPTGDTQDSRNLNIRNYAQTGANNVVLTPTGGDTIEGAATSNVAKGNDSQIVYVFNRTDWYIV